MTVLAIVQQHSCHPKNYKVTKQKNKQTKKESPEQYEGKAIPV